MTTNLRWNPEHVNGRMDQDFQAYLDYVDHAWQDEYCDSLDLQERLAGLHLTERELWDAFNVETPHGMLWEVSTPIESRTRVSAIPRDTMTNPVGTPGSVERIDALASYYAGMSNVSDESFDGQSPFGFEQDTLDVDDVIDTSPADLGFFDARDCQ